MVEVQKDVVLVLAYALNFSKVPRLELSVEEYRFVIDVVNVEGFGWILQFLRLEVRSRSASLDRLLHKLPYVSFFNKEVVRLVPFMKLF